MDFAHWASCSYYSSSSSFVAYALTLYSHSQLILTFHLMIRQVTTWVPVPSAASPHFLLVAITETTLFRGLFPSMWLGRLLAHLMRRWRLFLEPFPHCTPRRVSFYSPFLLGALWGMPLMTCRSSLLGLEMPRTGSSSAASLSHLDFRYLSSATILLGAGLRPSWKVSRDHKFSGPIIAPQNPAVRIFKRRGGFWWHQASVIAC